MHARTKITKRVAAVFVGASDRRPDGAGGRRLVAQAVVHTHIERSGTVSVSGYDGGVAARPAAPDRP